MDIQDNRPSRRLCSVYLRGFSIGNYNAEIQQIKDLSNIMILATVALLFLSLTVVKIRFDKSDFLF